jgi:hypothetical protein
LVFFVVDTLMQGAIDADQIDADRPTGNAARMPIFKENV